MHKRGLMAMVFGASMLLVSACDDGDDGSGDESNGDGESTGDGDTTGDGDPSSGDGDGNGDFGGSGGELEGCALNQTAADCMAEAGCSPVYGKPLVDDGSGGWCTETTEEYIGCASTGELCPALGKTLCEGDSYWRTTACVPDNLVVCEAPGDITGDC